MIGRVFNRVNDWDLTWVGFRAVRPAPDRDMSAWVVFTLALFYAPLSAAIAVLITLLVLGTAAPGRALWGMGAGAALAFLLLQCASAYFWNRRARQLRQAKGDR